MRGEVNMETEYYVGLDIGSNSVGYAVTNEDYEVLKFNKKAMWGTHVFDEGQQCAERRSFRSSRRRLFRKKQRVQLARELLAKEIAKVDKNFFTRLDESALLRKDKTVGSEYSLFEDLDFTDKDYHKKFPTIHHLIMYLIESDEKQDIRLIYLAVAYMLKNRGHFLIEVDKNDIEKVTSFDTVYSKFKNYFIENELSTNWSDNIAEDLGNLLKGKTGIKEKEKAITKLVFKNEKPTKSEAIMIKALCGGKFSFSVLLDNPLYSDLEVNSMYLSDGDFDDKLLALSNLIDENEIELLVRMKSIYDWALLSDILMGNEFISQGKIALYERHKKDLKLLKRLVKKYLPNKYKEVFIFSKKNLHNYASYSGNFRTSTNREKGLDEKKVEKLVLTKTYENAEFCSYIKKLFENVEVDEKDLCDLTDMKERLGLNNSFMPKQISKDNSVIPYQLYRYQLKKLLENSSKYHPFLNIKDDENLSIIDKLLAIIGFRIPYYVGPLNTAHGKFTWIERKGSGQNKILPWNFENEVDLDKSEEAFIRRMTGKCAFLAGEDVLCKNSLLYMKYMVLNEINNIKIDETPISVECKQNMFDALFINDSRNITKKIIKNWLISNNYMKEFQEIRGIDDDIKASLRSYHHFKNLLTDGLLNEKEVEEIIIRLSITNDAKRLKEFLKVNYTKLKDENIRQILNIKYKDYGRLSEKLLTGILSPMPGFSDKTNIINALWNTNYNLMELLSQRFGFIKLIEMHNEEYYLENKSSINTILEDMYIPNAVKRPIFRALDVIKEIRGIMKSEPKKIFIEMARAEEEKKRTKSRKTQLMELYESLSAEYRTEWRERLGKESEERLRSDRLYLYYVQLGVCMYTGKTMHPELLMGDTYDIDHIYPQSKVKDDSVHNNKVLVDSSYNKNIKSDKYPISAECQNKMSYHWHMLADRKLINKEKLYRLTRTTNFKDEELAGFINRQLVETRQSTKAVAKLLKDLFPNTEIVYVKAGLVSDFRQEFSLPKSREVNDLHHAKDAYLNIVMGNVYNTKFTKDPLNFIKSGDRYSVNIKDKKGMLSQDIERNGVVAWKGNGSTISVIKKYMLKNNINYTRYAFCRKGGFFDQNPYKATVSSEALIPRKKNLDPIFYGGYKSATASFFVLVKHVRKGKEYLSIKPIDLLYGDKFLNDDSFALDYCINNLKLEKPTMMLNKRILKTNSILSFDGFRASITSKNDLGKRIGLTSCIPLVLSAKQEAYVKRIESIINKVKKAKKEKKEYIINEKYDKVTKDENVNLYSILKEKCRNKMFSKIPIYSTLYESLSYGEERFQRLTLADQVEVLLEIVKAFKTGRRSPCNLSKIGGSASGVTMRINADISSTGFKTIEIIDQSVTGLFEKSTGNLLEL